VGVIFLDAAEYALRRQSGPVALIEQFENDDRDYITFQVNPTRS
jgi:hypothetical protein